MWQARREYQRDAWCASAVVLGPSLLMSMRNDEDKKLKEPEPVHKKKAKALSVRKMPAERKYILRCLAITGETFHGRRSPLSSVVLYAEHAHVNRHVAPLALICAGAEIPKHCKNSLGHTTWGMAVQVGNTRIQTAKCENVDGTVAWREPLQTEVRTGVRPVLRPLPSTWPHQR